MAYFPGLCNAGATCYLNSYLVTLYMTPEIRAKLFMFTHNESEEPREMCVPYQLRRLFVDLCTSKAPVSTQRLVDSFGWGAQQQMEQQDVQELMQALFEALGRAHGRSKELGTWLRSMCTGSMYEYLECMGGCGSSRGHSSPVMTIVVDIGEQHCLSEALASTFRAEIMQGENAVTCDACAGKQPARKGCRLEQYPYILSLQLQRFSFDWVKMERVKINDFISFEQFLEVDKPQQQEGEDVLRYELYSVLVHVGAARRGHYYTITKDMDTGVWRKIDDQRVSVIDTSGHFFGKEDVNFAVNDSAPVGSPPPALGGAPPPPPPPPPSAARGGSEQFPSSVGRNAYMLQYRRVEATNLPFPPKEDVPAREDVVSSGEDLPRDAPVQKLMLRVVCKCGERPQELFMDATATLSSLRARCASTFALSVEDVMLLLYDPVGKLPLDRIQGDPDALLLSLGLIEDTHVFVCEGSAAEPQNAVQMLSLRLVRHTLEDGLLDPEPFSIASSATIGELQEAVSVTCGIGLSDLLLASVPSACPGAQLEELLFKSLELKRDVFLADGDVVYVGWKASDKKEKAPLLLAVEARLHSTTISFDFPASGDTMCVDVDDRAPLADLKEKISTCINIAVDQFRLLRDVGSGELKDMRHSLERSGVSERKRVHVELGRPCPPGWHTVQVYTTHSAGGDGALDLVTCVLLNEMWSYAEVVEALNGVVTTGARVQVRVKSGDRMTRVFVEGKTVKQNYPGLRDGCEVVVQEVSAPVVADPVGLSYLQWHPQSLSTGPLRDLVVSKRSAVEEVTSVICSLLDGVNSPVHLEMRVVDYRTAMDVRALALLPWPCTKATLGTTLGSLRVKHGDVVVVRHVDEPCAVNHTMLSTDGRAALAALLSRPAHVPARQRGKQRSAGVVILTPQEQMEVMAAADAVKEAEEQWFREVLKHFAG